MPQSFRSPYLTSGKWTLGAEDKYLVTRKLPGPGLPGGSVSLETGAHQDGGSMSYTFFCAGNYGTVFGCDKCRHNALCGQEQCRLHMGRDFF